MQAAEPRNAQPAFTAEPTVASDNTDTDESGPVLSEGEIVGVLEEANAAEIVHGHLVVERLTDDALRKYAGDMIKVHTQAQVHLSELSAARSLGSADSALAQELSSRHGAVSNALETEQACARLDRRYALAEVLHHEELLELIGYALLPESRSDALRAELQRTRYLTQRHLARARALAERLGTGTGSALSTARSSL